MQAIIEILKVVARPASVVFLLTAVGVGLVLAFRPRTARHARWYFVGVFAFYWVFTTPACAEWLVRQASGSYSAIATAADARGAQVIVVLGAGNSTIRAGGRFLNEPSITAALRLLEAVRIYAMLDRPTMIVSGGVTGREPGAAPEAEALRDAAVRLGVAPDHILMELESTNTREEAIVIRRMLGDRAAQPLVLVTSPTHMRRSLAVFRAAGLDPIPSVSAYKSEGTLEHNRWLPNDAGLWLLTSVVYDTAANLYYWSRGWLSS